MGIDEVFDAKTQVLWVRALLDIAQHLALELNVLEHRFDDNVAILKALIPRRAADPCHVTLGFVTRRSFALDVFLEERAHVLQSATNRRVVHFVDAHRSVRFGGGDVSNTAAHEPATQNTDLVHVVATRACRDTAIFLQGLLRKEQRGQRARLGAHHQAPKVLGLGSIAGLVPFEHTNPHSIQRRLGRRIHTLRLLEQTLARFLEKHALADRIVF